MIGGAYPLGMKSLRGPIAAAAVLMLAAAMRAGAYFPDTLVRAVVRRWAPPSSAEARRLLDKYGLPADVTPGKVTWNDRGYWKRTVVWDRKPVYRSLDDMSVVEATVDYPLTAAQAAELLSFRDSLTVDMRTGELSARGDREEVDFLTMNLADEIARGDKSVAQARASYDRILSLAASGKTSPYLTKLLFRAPRPLRKE